MSNNNGVIRPPVNILSDLGFVLGTSSGDVGTNCMTSNICPWALFKPARSGAELVLPRTSLASLGFGFARVDGNNVGAQTTGPAYATTVQGLLNLYADQNKLWGKPANGWRYWKPRGLETYNERHRVTDFVSVSNAGAVNSNADGYDHKAKNPFGEFSAGPALVSRNYGHIYVDFGRRIAASSGGTDYDQASSYPANHISITDINAQLGSTLAMKYFGVVIVGPSSSSSALPKLIGKTTEIGSTRGQEALDIEIELTPSAYGTGNATIYPVLTNGEFASDQAPTSYGTVTTELANGMRLYSIPGAAPIVIQVTEDLIVITVWAKAVSRVDGKYDIRWAYQVDNKNSSEVTLTDGLARFRFSGKEFADTMLSGEEQEQLGTNGTITVAANGSYRYPASGNATKVIENPNVQQLIVGFRQNNALKTGSRQFIMPSPHELIIE